MLSLFLSLCSIRPSPLVKLCRLIENREEENNSSVTLTCLRSNCQKNNRGRLSSSHMFCMWRRNQGGGSHKVLSVFFISVLGASCQQKLKSLLWVINSWTENPFPFSALKGAWSCFLPLLWVKGTQEEVLMLVSWLRGGLEEQQEAIMLY